MRKNRTFLKAVSKWLIILVILAACVVLFLLLKKKRTTEKKPVEEYKTETSSEVQPVPVEASPAFVGDLVMHVSATGNAEAFREVTICPKISGEVSQLPVEEGSFVHKGDLILKLDARSYQLALDEAEDNLLKAQAAFVDKLTNFGMRKGKTAVANTEASNNQPYVKQMRQEYLKTKALYQQGKCKKKEVEQAKIWYENALAFASKRRETILANRSGLTQALIARKQALLNLSNTEIRAPFSGILGDQKVFVGQHISAGEPCFKLVDLSRMRIKTNVLESEIGDIKVGRKGRVKFVAFPEETFTGKVVAINPIVDSETKTCRVTVEVPNRNGKIKAGMYCFVKIEGKIYKSRFLVPKEAILIRDERKLVFIVRKGLAKWCYVKTGLENESFVEILHSTLNLKPGEFVITKGHYTLIHDAPVKVEKSK